MRRNILLGAALMAAVGLSEGAPVRLMVQPPRSRIAEVKPETRVDQCLGLYLYEWLAAVPEVRLVDEGQAASVLGAINSRAFVQRSAELYAPVNAAVAVDALITWRWADGKLVLDLQRQGGTKRLETAWTDAASIPKALGAVTDFLVAELGIAGRSDSPLKPAAEGARGRSPSQGKSGSGAQAAAEDGQFLADYYEMSRFRPKFDNSGEKQLDVLRPYLKRLPQDTWAAAAIVRSGTAMSTDTRKVSKPAGYVRLVELALPCLLGTAQEPVAIEFMEHNRHLPETIEKELLAMVAKNGKDEADTLADTLAEKTSPTDELGGDAKSMAADGAGDAIGILSGPKTIEQQAGAIRCLGAMRSKAAAPHIEQLAKSKEVKLRQAVAWSLGRYASPTGDVTLKALAGDSDTRTAFLAAYGLWQRGQKQDGPQGGGPAADSGGSGSVPKGLAGDSLVESKALLRLAATCLGQDPGCDEALEVMAKEGDATVVPKLKGCLESSVRQRALAVQGLQRLGALNGEDLTAALGDTDGNVNRIALTSLAPGQLAAARERLVVLANHPNAALAEAARLRLQTLAPADPRERRRFELAVEHPYVRRQIIAGLVKDGSAAAQDDLVAACDNADPHTRAYALEGLAERAPERARPVAMRLLQDPHRWVRLHAAAVAARVAGTGDAAPLKAAAAAEKDEVTRLYLEDALARAEGRPLPAPRPAANAVKPDKTTMFICGHGEDCVNSPVQGYYDLAYQPDEPAKKASAAGKIFLARVNHTAKNPVQVFFDPGWRDGFWLGMDEELGDLAALDGVVLGEESMYFNCWDNWSGGWRLFCREAGIDPVRVAGDKAKLTAPEKQAWWNWEQRVAIEGFNAMYEYIKLRYGKLRPGFQVCTFMPDQNGPCDFDREWKFDIGAGYYYETSNRHRYTQIRRFKTIWPDRPVLWLCDGTQSGLHGPPLNYKYPSLQQPLLSPHSPAYADALCAWLAGADPGYFYAQMALAKDTKPGPAASGNFLYLESLYPGSPSLQAALTAMFRGVEGTYRTAAEMKTVNADMAADRYEPGKEPVEDVMAILDQKDPFRLKVKSETDRVRLQLLLERKLAWDCVRLLADLPLRAQTNDVLLVGDMGAATGALRLPAAYDALDRVSALDGQDLSRYRVIAVARSEAAALRDGAVTALTEWLRKTPGLLYVRGWLNTSNTAEAAVIGDLDGKLEAEWPWVKDVEYRPSPVAADKAKSRAPAGAAGTGAAAKSGYRLTGGHAVAVEGGEDPSLVFWQGPGFKGGVVFDASDLEPGKLRDVLNRLCAEKGIGAAFTGPMGVETAELPGLKAMTSCQAAVTNVTLAGVDMPTGVRDPVLGKSRTGAFLADGFTGTYVASWNGVSVLGELPLRAVKAVEGGLELEGEGLIQAVSASGDVEVRCDGRVPEPVAADNVLSWLLESAGPGLARVERDDKGGAVTFVRAKGKMRISAK